MRASTGSTLQCPKLLIPFPWTTSSEQTSVEWMNGGPSSQRCHLGCAVDWIVSPPNSDTEVLTGPHCDGVRRWGLWEVIGLDKVMRWGFPIRDIRALSLTWRMQGKAAVCKPGRKLSSGTELADTLNLTFQPPELWDINSCCLSRSIYSNFFFFMVT